MQTFSSSRFCLWLFPFVHAQIRVLSPANLVTDLSASSATKGTIYGSTAPFGAPSYGKTIIGHLRVGSNNCTAGVKQISSNLKVSSENGEKIVNVVIVRRTEHVDECSFVSQVRIFEKTADAAAVIVVDRATPAKSPQELQEEVVPDDGNGYIVKIPSILVSHAEGNKLLEYAHRGPVIVELEWRIPQYPDTVIADYWMSAGSRESQQFLKNFKDSAATLQHHLEFIPHYHVFLPATGKQEGDMCAPSKNNQWHCAPDPDGTGSVTGADVLQEDVRQLCLWFLTTERSETAQGMYSQKFWDYVSQYPDRCSLSSTDPATRFGDTCSMKLMTEIGVDTDKLQGCVNNRRGEFLDQQVEQVAWSPHALRINGWRYRGGMDPETVVRAVCAGYSKHLEECEELLNRGFFHRQVLVTKRVVQSYMTDQTFSGLLVLCVLLCGLNLYLYRRVIKRTANRVMREEVMLEVRSQISDYAKLENGDTIR